MYTNQTMAPGKGRFFQIWVETSDTSDKLLGGGFHIKAGAGNQGTKSALNLQPYDLRCYVQTLSTALASPNPSLFNLTLPGGSGTVAVEAERQSLASMRKVEKPLMRLQKASPEHQNRHRKDFTPDLPDCRILNLSKPGTRPDRRGCSAKN